MTVHVYPLNDWIEHKVDEDAGQYTCPCEPRIEYVDPDTGVPHEEPLVIHNALDWREKEEIP